MTCNKIFFCFGCWWKDCGNVLDCLKYDHARMFLIFNHNIGCMPIDNFGVLDVGKCVLKIVHYA